MSSNIEFSETENSLIDECYQFIIEHVRKAGEIVRDGFYKLNDKDIYPKAYKFEVVTEYDKCTEDYLINQISTKYPNHKFVAEESAADNELSDNPTWIFDPIDGTANYVHRNPNVAISVALAIKKTIVIGIIYNPILNEFYQARKGMGSYLNNEPIKCSKIETLDDAIYMHELSMLQSDSTRDNNFCRIYKFSGCATTRCLGSAALSMAYVARGAVDCYSVDCLKAWDIAAGDLLIREAGGLIYNVDGSPLNVMKGGVVCAGTENLCQILIEGIRECENWKVIIDKQK